MKKIYAIVVVACSLFLASCSTTTPIAATSNPVGNKCGEASTTRYFGLGGSANIGINAAAKNGGITKISHVDFSQKSFLGIVTTYTTRVYGE